MPSPKMSTGRNLALMCVGAMIVVFSMFGVTLRDKVMRLANRQQVPASTGTVSATKQGPIPTRSPNPGVGRPQPEQASTPSTPVSSSPDPAGWRRMKAYVGKWNGRMVEAQSISVLNFELRENPLVEGGFSGYSELVAMPIGGVLPVQGKAGVNPVAAVLAAMAPTAVAWTGEPDGKGIVFTVEKRVGKAKCPMSSLILTPFGTNQLLAEWKSDGCPDGQVLLEKMDH